VEANRVLFVQFTNPAAYPPLENAAGILRASGVEVRFVATESRSSASLRFPRELEEVTERAKFVSAGWRQRLAYIRFAARVRAVIRSWNPTWIYVSDPIGCAAALAAMVGTSVRSVYHEHDAPLRKPPSSSVDPVRVARNHLARVADVVIAPNQTRLSMLIEEANRPATKIALCVWNCVSLRECYDRTAAQSESVLRLYFHGSIVRQRLPMTILSAMVRQSSDVELSIVGYESEPGYVKGFASEAERLGIGAKVKFLGPMSRGDALREASKHDVGICFYLDDRGDSNMNTMVGASNKPFDYLAQGLALMVSDSAEWRAMLEPTELGVFCDATNTESVAGAIARFAGDPGIARRAQVHGPALIKGSWNYERQFQPVLEAIQAS
jgi:glycosyltransferase involved in cell wall biosynthesis